MVVALFVTADVPIETINEVLTAATNEERSFSAFCLVRSPSQTDLDKLTYAPVQSFASGFANASLDDLKRYKDDIGRGQHERLDDNQFAVLDERSMQDRTINYVVNTTYRRVPDDDEEEEPESKEASSREWQAIRILFEHAGEVTAISFHKFLGFGPESIDLVDENGIWHPPTD